MFAHGFLPPGALFAAATLLSRPKRRRNGNKAIFVSGKVDISIPDI
jgi:hypothetical protein